MLKRQQHGDLLLRDSPPVFGKPWYWQRSSSTMESTRSLAQVIMEMRDEIKKLEAENRELRGDCGQRSFGAAPGEGSPVSSAAEQRAGMEENPYVNLRRNASAPVLETQYTGMEKRPVTAQVVAFNLFIYHFIIKTTPQTSKVMTHRKQSVCLVLKWMSENDCKNVILAFHPAHVVLTPQWDVSCPIILLKPMNDRMGKRYFKGALQ